MAFIFPAGLAQVLRATHDHPLRALVSYGQPVQDTLLQS
jgi:hypothetical protein